MIRQLVHEQSIQLLIELLAQGRAPGMSQQLGQQLLGALIVLRVDDAV